MRLSIIAVYPNFHIKRLASCLEPHKYLGFELHHYHCAKIIRQYHNLMAVNLMTKLLTARNKGGKILT